jgi:hypothetical protein
MREEKETAHRIAAYSDAVFVVIVRVIVLELRAPDQPAFSALTADFPLSTNYRRNRNHVIGISRVPHSKKETQSENRE